MGVYKYICYIVYIIESCLFVWRLSEFVPLLYS